MKPVIQQQRTGCGIASVAAVAGITYPAAKRAAQALGIHAEDEKLWSETLHVRKLLNHFKIRASKQKPFQSWQTLPNLALIALKWHKENQRIFWHWAVFVREGSQSYVLDSKKALRQHKRTDFGRMKPKWFIGLRLFRKL